MRATVRVTPWAFAVRHAMMFASSDVVAATNSSDFLIPASANTLGLAPLPWITRASSCSVARSTSASLCSMRMTSCPSCESIRAVLKPTSPAPMITVRIALWFDGQHRQAALAGEVQLGEALAHPLFRNLRLDQGLVSPQVHVVYDGGGCHGPGYLRAHLLLGLYDPVGPDPLENPGVKFADRPGHDERHPH